VAHAENSVVVNRPSQEVFGFLADGERSPEWRSGVVEIKKVSGEGVGTIYRQRVKGPGGRPVAADYRITEYQPYTRWRSRRSRAPFARAGSMTCSRKTAAQKCTSHSMRSSPD